MNPIDHGPPNRQDAQGRPRPAGQDRPGAAWILSLVIAAAAGALATWWMAPAPPPAPQAWAVAAGAVVAAVLALAVGAAARRSRPTAADTDAAADPGHDGRRSASDPLAADSAAADTRPVVWADTIDPQGLFAATTARASSPEAGRRAAFGDDGAIDSDAATGAVAPPQCPGTVQPQAGSGGPTDGATVAAGPDDGRPAPGGGPLAPGAVGTGSTDAGAAAPAGASAHDALQEALREALAGGEMRLVYQPIFDLEARHVHAVEALLRWPRAAKSLMPTRDLVALADRGGFGDALGRFVLQGACQQVLRWRQVLGSAAPARVAVNLSRSQCLAATLLDEIDELLAAHGLRADTFQVELAERDVAADAGVEARLHELRALGLAVALDNFGQAHSSLTALQRLPVDQVKIDRQLVHRAEAGGTVRMVLESTLGLAAQLGLEVVAEGVETTEQLATVRSLGCRLAQGHALCPPMDAFALTRRLRGGHWLAAAAPGSAPSTAQGGG
jgi:EAL domain-containing protein (putative c-di-GMP-specific phosphodiesterase class I)